MTIATTERLAIRRLTLDDASFILTLLNDPAWQRYIGDMQVDSLKAARRYLQQGPLNMYEKVGFGMFAVTLKHNHQPVGLCGLVKRDALDDVDMGYALLAEFRRQGYAREAAVAILDYARDAHALARVAAITLPDNATSVALLEELGFVYSRAVNMPHEARPLSLYLRDLR